MHPLIEKLLTKRGVKDVAELTVEEKDVFDRWQKTLTSGVSLESLSELAKQFIGTADAQLRDFGISHEKMERLVVARGICQLFLGAIENPKSEAESLEKHLASMLQ